MKYLQSARSQKSDMTRYKESTVVGNGLGVMDYDYTIVDVVDNTGLVNPSIRCKAGEALSKGDLVYPSGYDASLGLMEVSKAEADGADPKKVAWFAATEDISSGEEGVAVGVVEIEEQDTDAQDAGTPIYLSATAGEWSFSVPTGGGESVQQVGVSTVKDASEGKVLLMPFYSKAVTVNTTTE